MELGKVIGTCVATQKVAGLTGVKLLVVQPVDHNNAPVGEPLFACDGSQAGYGDLVYIVKGREGAASLPDTNVAVDATIVGIVDMVST